MVDNVVLMVDSVVDAGVVNEVVAAGVVHDMPSAGMAVPQMVDLHFGSHQLKVSMKIVLVFSWSGTHDMHKLQPVNEFYEWNHPNDPIKKTVAY